MKTKVRLVFGISLVLCLQLACVESGDKYASVTEPSTNTPSADNTIKKYLYVASGACYAGGLGTSVRSNTVARFESGTGKFDRLVVDYNAFSPGDAPVGIGEQDKTKLYVLIENASGRRVDSVAKDGLSIATYLTNSTALSGVLRALWVMPDSSLLVSKSVAIEKFSSGKARVMAGASPFVNAPASTCATSTTLMSGLTTFANGKILFLHAGATPNNKFGLIASGGYNVTADCLASQVAPTTLALPTAVLLHSSGHTLVAYGSTTSTSNFIYSYTIDANLNTISNVTASYTNYGNVMGPSAMAEDPETHDVFVANGASTHNTIERFSYDPATRLLTRVGSVPFVGSSVYTKCVSGLKVME